MVSMTPGKGAFYMVGCKTRTPSQASSSGQATIVRSYGAGVGVSAFELDFFGRVANLEDAALQSFTERLAAQQDLVDASNRAYTLAEASWKGGASSYLEVLVAQRALYAAQQTLITLRQAEQANRVTLFKVLGDGGQVAGS